MKDVTFQNNAEDKYIVDLSRLLPYLKHKTIRTVENIVQLHPNITKCDIELLKSIAHIWRHTALFVNINEFPQNGYGILLKELFGTQSLTTTAKLSLNTKIESYLSLNHFSTNNALIHLCEHPRFYNCNNMDVCLVLLQVEDIVDFVHSIPFHRQDQFTIQFLTGDKCALATVINFEKFLDIVEACKQRFLNAVTPTSYTAFFIYFYAVDEPTPESLIFQIANTGTREKLELTDTENDGKRFLLRRFPI